MDIYVLFYGVRIWTDGKGEEEGEPVFDMPQLHPGLRLFANQFDNSRFALPLDILISDEAVKQ